MGGDKLLYYGRQLIFVGQTQAILYVLDNNLCALFIGQIVVRIGARLILRKENRIL